MKKVSSIMLVLVIMLNTLTFTYAYTFEDYAATISEYLAEDKFDLLGWKGEDLYFKLRDMYAEEHSTTKIGRIIKTIEFDAKAIDIQGELTYKAIDENKEIYMLCALVLFFYGSKGLKVKINKPKVAPNKFTPELDAMDEILKKLITK